MKSALNYHNFLSFTLEWLASKSMDENFEKFSKDQLAEVLSEFYPSARQKPKDGQEIGDHYC